MKLRVKLVLLVTAILIVTAFLIVPRIIEAKRAGAAAQNAVSANPVQGRKQEVLSGLSIRNDTSPPLREMKQKPLNDGGPEREANHNPKIPHFHRDTPDRVIQNTPTGGEEVVIAAMPTPGMNINGIQFPGVSCNCAPPDTNGEVGATQYVQM